MRRMLPFLVLMAGSAALLLGGVGRLPLLGRDEALYAEAGREMLASGDWITPRVNGGPFLEKPPLYYWLAAGSYRVFGVSPFAARLPAALLALLAVGLTAALGARAWGARAGWLAGMALATCLQMAIIGRMGLMDAPLTTLTVVAVAAYASWRGRPRLALAAAFGLCVGLAVLLKGGAGLAAVGVVAVHTAYLAARARRLTIAWRGLAATTLAGVVAAGVAAPWFVAMAARHGETFGATLLLREHLHRIAHPMQGHGGSVLTYLGVTVLGFFPWVVFLPGAFRGHAGESEQAAWWRGLCVVWMLVVLIPFSLVRTKLPGYITPLFPPMALLAGAVLDCRRRGKDGRAAWGAMVAMAGLFAGLVCLLPAAGARLGERIGVSHEARLLVGPSIVWAVGYGVIAVGAGGALAGRVVPALALVTGGQMVVLAAVLVGVLPAVSPFLGGGSAALAMRAARELPRARIVLYETHPETVNFALRRSVPTYDKDRQAELRAELAAGDVALIAPVGEEDFWSRLPARRTWRAGDRVLLDLPAWASRDGEGAGER